MDEDICRKPVEEKKNIENQLKKRQAIRTGHKKYKKKRQAIRTGYKKYKKKRQAIRTGYKKYKKLLSCRLTDH